MMWLLSVKAANVTFQMHNLLTIVKKVPLIRSFSPIKNDLCVLNITVVVEIHDQSIR